MSERKVYFGNWTDLQSMWNDFQGFYSWNGQTGPVVPDIGEILLLAWYGNGSYCGRALVIGRKPDGTLYEVHASHCSCHGLEGQWDPEPATVESLPRTCTSDLYDYYDGVEESFDQLMEELKRG